MSEKAQDYKLSTKDASELKGICLLPYEYRSQLLAKYDKDKLIDLFAQFIGLANSVIYNNREMMIEYAVINQVHHPDRDFDLNLPTIFGALQGAELANSVNQNKLCNGCAYRLGTIANQSPITTCDVDWQLNNEDDFYCHKKFDDEGNPITKCIGFQLHRNQQA